MKFLVVCCIALIGLAVADKAPARFGRQEIEESGPYAPSGWKPDGPQLTLPAQEYGPPPTADVEVSEEQVEFAGQTVGTETVVAPQASNKYLPPAAAESVDRNQDPLSVQALPLVLPSHFKLNTGEIIARQRLQQQRAVLFQQLQQQQQQLQRIRTNSRQSRIVFQPTAFRPAPPPQTFVPTQQRLTLPGAQTPTAFAHHKKPNKKPHFAAAQQQQQQFAAQKQQSQFSFQQQQQQQQQFFQRQEQQPQDTYGPPQEPQAVYGPPEAQLPAQEYGSPQQSFPPQQPDQTAEEPESADEEEEEEAEDETELVDGPAVSIANAINTNGQYYILGEDNRLQRVVYMTSQTNKDKKSNGFTAKLQYAPVEPIRDPIYAYDGLGQLVRIYNK